MAITATAWLAAGVTACGGGGRGERPPEPVSRTPTLTGAAVAPGAAEVALDSAVALRADPTWSNTTAGTTPGVTVTWTRRGTAGGTVTPDAGDGRGATYRAGAVGTDTLEAAVAAAGAAVTARAVVTVRGPRVARVAFPARVAYVGVGGTFALPALGRGATGGAVAKAVVAYRALDPAVAGVGPDGTLTGTAFGTARVVAEASTVAASGAALPADTLRVVVAGDAGTLALGLADTLAQAGRTVTVVGVDGGATATLAGSVMAAAAAPGGVSLTPPAGVFTSCRPFGATAPLAVTSGGRSRTLPFAVYAPVIVALAPGQHRRVTDAAAGGCPVAVDAAGTYVAMPFAWDRQVPNGGTAGGPTQAVTTALRLSTGADPAAVAPSSAGAAARAASSRLTARVPALAPHAGPPVDDVVRVAVAASAGAAVRRASFPAGWSGGACPIPTAVGDAMPVGTLRDAQGRFVQAASVNGGGGTSEPWTLAAIAPGVAVFFDSALVRARGGIAGADARAQAFAAAYDTTVAPLLAQVTEGVPDADGNGHLVVLVALRAGNALAYPSGYARPDCEAGGSVLGEAIGLGGDAFVAADNLVAPAVSVAMHESAHVVDNAQRYYQAPYSPAMRQDTWWSREGYAVLMQHVWSLGPVTPADAFTGNRAAAAARTVLGTAQGGFCERPERAVLGAWYALNANGYPLACQAVRYALGQLALQQPGLAPKALLVRWSQLRDRRRFADALNGLLGQSRAPQDVAGEWYLSWLADGAAGTAATLQDPAADLRALYRAFFPGSAYPVPAATLTVGAALDVTLGEPDAAHVQVDLPGRGWIAAATPAGGGLPTDRVDVMLFRAR